MGALISQAENLRLLANADVAISRMQLLNELKEILQQSKQSTKQRLKVLSSALDCAFVA